MLNLCLAYVLTYVLTYVLAYAYECKVSTNTSITEWILLIIS